MNKIYQKSFPGGKSAGFTLIELLVVVLIIGILAAVALPQYQKAVARSRLAGLITLASSVAQAEQRYFMANGEYTTKAEELDVNPLQSYTATDSPSGPQTNYRSGPYLVSLYLAYGGAPRVVAERTDIPAFILWPYAVASSRLCGVRADSAQVGLGKSICASYGAPTGDGGVYYYYKLN